MVARAMLGVLLVLAGALTACGARGPRQAMTRSQSAGTPSPVAAVILDAAGRERTAVRLAGAIDRATADGSGGWYAAVALDRSASYTLVHLDARGHVDPRWHVPLGPNPPDDTYANLAADSGRVYLGGNFGMIGGVPRRSLGAVAAATGAGDPSWPAAPAQSVSAVGAIVLAGNRVIVAHGEQIDAFEAHTGRPVFHTATGPDNTEGPGVRALAVSSRWVYVGGRFTKVGGLRRVGLARIDSASGRVDAWRPPAFDTAPCSACDGDVMALSTSPTALYVLGAFSAAGGSPAPGGLTALSQATGKPLGGFRTPQPGRDAVGDPGSYTAAAVVGGRVFVGGDTRRGFVALDAFSGAPVPAWHPTSRRASVSVLAVSGAQVLVGGSRLGR